ncbi:MAG TPA: FG-GAP-like repeat-containing protein [Usitatibacter sp.]|jgi:hypothetical protein|nr:FG-GAP-like repeat-containing protein [Usitatibacter sp.]
MNVMARLWIGALLLAVAPAVASAGQPSFTPIEGSSLGRVPAGAKSQFGAAESKIDATLLAAVRAVTTPPVPGAAQAIPENIQSFIRKNVEADNTIFVVIRGTVTPELVASLRAVGARDISQFPESDMVTANVPASAIPSLADHAEVRTVGPRQKRQTQRYIPKADGPLAAQSLASGIAKAGSITWQGVTAHQANVVQSAGITGAGVRVCVISDGIDTLSARVLTGDLPSVTVLSGQAGSGDEGTAMLEIVHDMAPGAALAFATGDPSSAQMAANIRSFRTIGCNIIVDDLSYLGEGAFQDDDIAQAVNDVTSSGLLYFSAAANSGNVAHGNSGTWEGDFNPYPTLPSTIASLYCSPTDSACLSHVRVQNFAGLPYASLTVATDTIGVQWADPLTGTLNDYDVVVLDAAESGYYCNPGINRGFQRPVEISWCDTGSFPAGSHVYVVRWSGVNRPIRLDTFRGRISGGTVGSTFGHNAAATAITVGAVDVRNVGSSSFTSSNQVTFYSSDGPRKMFFNVSGLEITPGNSFFATNGGNTVAKVDIAASDCGSTTTPGFTPFCGTSAAAPTAASIAALVKSANPAATRVTIANALASGALDIEAAGRDVDAGNGIVMAPAAVRAVLQPLVITRSFSASSVIVGHNLNFVTQVSNPNAVAITGVTLPVTFPTSLLVLTPFGTSGTGCIATESDSVNGIAITNATIPAQGSCTFTMLLTAGSLGTSASSANTATTAIGLTSSASSASVLVLAVPVPGYTLSANSLSVNFGDTVTITATVTAASGGALLSGLTFSTTTGPIPGCSGLLLSSTPGSTATCSTNSLSAGPQHITVTYPGDANYGAASVSIDVVVHVPTTTAVTSSLSSSLNTQTVFFTATVSAATGTPTGTVQFRSDGTVINGCSAVALSGLEAQCSTGVLPSGSHTISAIYSGDTTFVTSTGTTAQAVDTALPPPPTGSAQRLDFNGDGHSDIAWQLPDGSLSIWLENGLPIGRGMVFSPAPGSVTKAADFNGDHKTDFVRQLADGSAAIYLMNGIDIAATVPLAPGSGWHLVNVGDFNGDGKPDLLWRHDDGSVQIWIMDGTTVTSSTPIMGPNPYWTPAKVGDFDGDGKSDIVWVNVDGTTSLWLMNGASRTAAGTLMAAGTGWRVIQVADFNGDGKSDLLWRHDGDGAVSMWLMDGLTVLDKGPLMPANSGWSVMQVGHLDNNASDDIIWVHTNGTVSAWLMSGRTPVLKGQLMPAGSGWSVTQLLDVAAQGSAQLIWTHTLGNVGLWFVDWTSVANGSFTITSHTPLLPAGNPWVPAVSIEANH